MNPLRPNPARQLRIRETNFGRDAGWVVEQHGRPIAILTDWRNEDMFWDSYRLEIVADDPKLRESMASTKFWLSEFGKLVWRNKEFGDVAVNPFPAGEPFPEPGRVTMRGLYLPIDDTEP